VEEGFDSDVTICIVYGTPYIFVVWLILFYDKLLKSGPFLE